MHIIDITIRTLKVDRVSVYYAEYVEETVGSSVILIDGMNKINYLKRDNHLNAHHFMDEKT